MRVPLTTGVGSLELVGDSEADWGHLPVCDNPGMVAQMILADDSSPTAALVRALLATTMEGSTARQMDEPDLVEALEAALRDGSVRLTERRELAPQRLASYTPPAKPSKDEPPPPRVAKSTPSTATPEETTQADAACLEEASKNGAPLVAQ